MLLAGAAGVGKSMLAIELAYELAHGTKAFGAYDVVRPLRVAYVQLELVPDQLQGRFKAVQSVYGETDGVFQASPKEFVLPSREERLVEALKKREIEVVILDPMYLMLAGGELSLSEVRPFLDSVNRVRSETGCVAIILAHTKKVQWDSSGRAVDMGFDAISGHRAFANWADTIALVGQRGSGIRLDWAKHRNTKHPENLKPINFLRTKGLPFVNEDSPYSKAVNGSEKVKIVTYLQAHGPTFRSDLSRALPDIPATTLARAVQDCIDTGMVTEETKGRRSLLSVGG